MSRKNNARNIEASLAAIGLSDDQRNEIAKALGIDVKFVPEELGILGVPQEGRAHLGIPVDRAGQFAPALILM